MEETHQFRLQPIFGIQSYLINEAGDTVAQVNGVSLEKAYRLQTGHFLLLLSDKGTSDEGLHLAFLDPSGTLLEQIDLFPASTASLLGSLTVVSDTCLRFRPQSTKTVTVEVEPEGFFNPISGTPAEAASSQGRLSKHYLRVRA